MTIDVLFVVVEERGLLVRSSVVLAAEAADSERVMRVDSMRVEVSRGAVFLSTYCEAREGFVSLVSDFARSLRSMIFIFDRLP